MKGSIKAASDTNGIVDSHMSFDETIAIEVG
jgi:hypothetical protein